jgi:hypothetical protein
MLHIAVYLSLFGAFAFVSWFGGHLTCAQALAALTSPLAASASQTASLYLRNATREMTPHSWK